MASFTAQMEELQKQQAILAEKIKKEEERKRKLNKEASIGRLEALIEPITQHLNKEGGSYQGCVVRSGEKITFRDAFEECRMRQERIMNSGPILRDPTINVLTNEEIFVTLLGVIKKQDVRIGELEGIIKKLKK